MKTYNQFITEVLDTQKAILKYAMGANLSGQKNMLLSPFSKTARLKFKNRSKGLKRAEKKVTRLRLLKGHKPAPKVSRKRRAAIKLAQLGTASTMMAGVIANQYTDDAIKLGANAPVGRAFMNQFIDPKAPLGITPKLGHALGDAIQKPNYYKSKYYADQAVRYKKSGNVKDYEKYDTLSKAARKKANETE